MKVITQSTIVEEIHEAINRELEQDKRILKIILNPEEWNDLMYYLDGLGILCGRIFSRRKPFHFMGVLMEREKGESTTNVY